MNKTFTGIIMSQECSGKINNLMMDAKILTKVRKRISSPRIQMFFHMIKQGFEKLKEELKELKNEKIVKSIQELPPPTIVAVTPRGTVGTGDGGDMSPLDIY